MSETYAGCPWPIDTGCLDVEKWDALTPELRDYATALASSALHGLSAGRIGGCPITIRPRAHRDCCLPPYAWSPGINTSGQWVNTCGCADQGPRCSVEIPGPVGEIYSIRIDGEQVDPSQFRLDGNVLVWQGGGECPIPATQDVTLPDTEPGTFSITYLNSYKPDILAQRAAAYLAWEFALACEGSSTKTKCRLSSNVRSVVRMGMSMEIDVGVFPEGLTGITEVDAWIDIVNPKRHRAQTTVHSPDLELAYIQGNPVGEPDYESGGGA